MSKFQRAFTCIVLMVLLCSGGIFAFAQAETDSIITNVVFDGVSYQNRTDISWEWHKPIPEGGIQWDGDPEFLSSADFGIVDLATVPDPNFHLSEYVKNQIMFMGKNDGGFYDIQQMAADYDCIIVGYLAPTENYVIQSITEATYEDLIELRNAIAQESLVYGDTVSLRYAFAEETTYYPNDPWNGAPWDQAGGENWGVKQIGAPNAWNYRAYMKPMNIGVIDSFIDSTHPDLDAENLGNMDFVSFWLDTSWRDLAGKIGAAVAQIFPWVNMDENAFLEEFQHGTHVSGTFGAIHDNQEGISGVFPYAHIVGISTHWNRDERSQVIDNIGSYYSNRSDFYMEMFYLLALRSKDVHIINRSLGYFEEDQRKLLALTEAEWSSRIQFYTTSCGLGRYFDALRDLNYDFVFVLAAGNEKLDARACSWLQLVDNAYLKDRLIVVGAYNWRLNYCNGFSNYGSAVDIVAPGAGIYSTVPKLTDYTYLSWNGTSQAAPHVAGTAAMVWSIAPDTLTGPQVKSIILNSASEFITSGYAGDTLNGNPRRYPMLNAEAAVKAVFDSSTITGNVTDAVTSLALSDATIQLFENGTSIGETITDKNGEYRFTVKPGLYQISVSKPPYRYHQSDSFAIKAGETLNMDFSLSFSQGSVSGRVIDENGQLLQNVSMSMLTDDGVSGTDFHETVSGQFSLSCPTGDSYFFFSKAGYEPLTVRGMVSEGQNTNLGDIMLQKVTVPEKDLQCYVEIKFDPVYDGMLFTLRLKNAQNGVSQFDAKLKTSRGLTIVDTSIGLYEEHGFSHTEDSWSFYADSELLNGAELYVTATDGNGRTFSGSKLVTSMGEFEGYMPTDN